MDLSEVRWLRECMCASPLSAPRINAIFSRRMHLSESGLSAVTFLRARLTSQEKINYFFEIIISACSRRKNNNDPGA